MNNKELIEFRSKYVREGYRKAVKEIMMQINEADDIVNAEQIKEGIKAVASYQFRISEIINQYRGLQLSRVSDITNNQELKEFGELYKRSLSTLSPEMNRIMKARKAIIKDRPLSDRQLQNIKIAIETIMPDLEKLFILAQKALRICYNTNMKLLSNEMNDLKTFF